MIYSGSLPDAQDEAVIASIHSLCEKIEQIEQAPRSWNGLLSRQVFERRTAGGKSNSADGGGDPWRALEGYRRAMRYAAQRAADPSFSYTPELILALHFMMTEHDRNARPGAWRSNKVQVLDPDAEVVYEPPDAERIPSLVQELTDSLNRSNELPPVIRAAIAHLNILRIHPFRDGSGRMARCLQALILSHETILPPEISSMEEYFGQYTLICNEALSLNWRPLGAASRYAEMDQALSHGSLQTGRHSAQKGRQNRKLTKPTDGSRVSGRALGTDARSPERDVRHHARRYRTLVENAARRSGPANHS